MKNAAANEEIFSFYFTGHVNNVRAVDVFNNDPSKNRLIFRNDKYNYNNLKRSYKILFEEFFMY